MFVYICLCLRLFLLFHYIFIMPKPSKRRSQLSTARLSKRRRTEHDDSGNDSRPIISEGGEGSQGRVPQPSVPPANPPPSTSTSRPKKSFTIRASLLEDVKVVKIEMITRILLFLTSTSSYNSSFWF